MRVRYAGRAPLNGDDSAERRFLSQQSWYGGPKLAQADTASLTTGSVSTRPVRSFDYARAHGLEAKVELTGAARKGVTAFLNYAFGHVEFWNPVTGGFITEADHLTESTRFLAPMDQTHTFTGGATYRHSRSGVWGGVLVEYGSGTPTDHGGSEHAEEAGEAVHVHREADETAARVPGHFLGNLSLGVDLWRRAGKRPLLTLRADIENVSNNVYLIAQEGAFTRLQYSIPRLVSVTAQVRF